MTPLAAEGAAVWRPLRRRSDPECRRLRFGEVDVVKHLCLRGQAQDGREPVSVEVACDKKMIAARIRGKGAPSSFVRRGALLGEIDVALGTELLRQRILYFGTPTEKVCRGRK